MSKKRGRGLPLLEQFDPRTIAEAVEFLDKHGIIETRKGLETEPGGEVAVITEACLAGDWRTRLADVGRSDDGR